MGVSFEPSSGTLWCGALSGKEDEINLKDNADADLLNISITRLPSTLWSTTRKCVHLATRGHFRSRGKDGGYTIRFAVPKNPVLHANITALCLIERQLLPIEVLPGIFDLLGSSDLDLDPMTFVYELDP